MARGRRLKTADNYGLFFLHILDGCDQIWLKQICPKNNFTQYITLYLKVFNCALLVKRFFWLDYCIEVT